MFDGALRSSLKRSRKNQRVYETIRARCACLGIVAHNVVRMMLCVFFSEFDNELGPKVTYQVPSDFLSSSDFDAISDYVITKRDFCGKVFSVTTSLSGSGTYAPSSTSASSISTSTPDLDRTTRPGLSSSLGPGSTLAAGSYNDIDSFFILGYGSRILSNARPKQRADS